MALPTEMLCAPIVLETELQDHGKSKSVEMELYGRLAAVEALPGVQGRFAGCAPEGAALKWRLERRSKSFLSIHKSELL